MKIIANDAFNELESHLQEIVDLVGERTGNVYSSRGYCCAEAVIYVLNGAFGGGLSADMAVQLGSGFCHGMGAAGCTCGSLAGAEIALGIFLSHRLPGGMKKKAFEKLALEMHDRFKVRFSATCCRTLLNRRKNKKGATCKELTVGGAELVATLLLENRPELAQRVDKEFLQRKESKVGRLAGKVFGGKQEE